MMMRLATCATLLLLLLLLAAAADGAHFPTKRALEGCDTVGGGLPPLGVFAVEHEVDIFAAGFQELGVLAKTHDVDIYAAGFPELGVLTFEEDCDAIEASTEAAVSSTADDDSSDADDDSSDGCDTAASRLPPLGVFSVEHDVDIFAAGFQELGVLTTTHDVDIYAAGFPELGVLTFEEDCDAIEASTEAADDDATTEAADDTTDADDDTTDADDDTTDADDAAGDALAAYPGYTGDIAVTGTISVTADGDDVSLAWDMSGLEASATGGIHIHTGVSCDDASLVGGHFYQPFDEDDPWITNYASDADGNAASSVSVASGYALAEVIGHAVVVHDSDKARIACGIIGGDAPDAYYAEMSDYPGYDAAANNATSVSGDVAVFADGDSVTLTWMLTGLQETASGGIHVHAGTTCDDADDVGGHYWTPSTSDDPWNSVDTVYQSKADGSAQGQITVDCGYALADVLTHAIVVHDSEGERVACGTIGSDEVVDGGDETQISAGARPVALMALLVVMSFAGIVLC